MIEKIHLVCNAHLDPVWLWEWEEGAGETLSTFRIAADFCEKYNGFVFNHNEAILYEWIEEYDPKLFERIQKLVRENKWHIMGGWYIQPDCNMPSGESFVRQILLGRNYFKEKFNKMPTTAINFDPFGHTRGLVQILKKSDFDSYLFCRPSKKNCELENEIFMWEGYDGSVIKACRAFDMYSTQKKEALNKLKKYIGLKNINEKVGLLLWGIGNHGGGPSKIDLENLNNFILEDKKNIEIIHSIPENYFNEIDIKKLPLHSQDLNPCCVGCYTAQIRIKRQHRKLENELYFTEKIVSNAWIRGYIDYPKEKLIEVEKDLATSQFHDILPGSSIKSVEDYSLRLLSHGQEILSRLKLKAFFALTKNQIKSKENEIPILVYNPHPYIVKTIIECELSIPVQNWKDTFFNIEVYNSNNKLLTQVEKEASNFNLDWRKKVIFYAKLKPSQMNRFDCKLKELENKPIINQKCNNDKILIKNKKNCVEISKKTGLITSYKRDEIEYLKFPSALPIILQDYQNTWLLENPKFGNKIGEFKLLSKKEAALYAGSERKEIESVQTIEDGTVRTVVEALFGYNNSHICVHYKISKITLEIEISLKVNWNEKNKALKLAFYPDFNDSDFIGQVAYGLENFKNTKQEKLYQKFALITDKQTKNTFSIIDDCVYGANYRNNEFAITLLRSPVYSGLPFNDREISPQDRFVPRIDQGERIYNFWLNIGKLNERLEIIDREALTKNEKPMVLSYFPSGGKESLKNFIMLSDNCIQITAIKQSTQDDNCLIVRLFEPIGKRQKTNLILEILKINKTIEFSPFEIKTFEINIKTKIIRELNLIEQVI